MDVTVLKPASSIGWAANSDPGVGKALLEVDSLRIAVGSGNSEDPKNPKGSACQ